jgi:hypothetical protein
MKKLVEACQRACDISQMPSEAELAKDILQQHLPAVSAVPRKRILQFEKFL